MSKLERISAFIDVIENKSFTIAAKQLGMSTAAISKKVGVLEKDLGVQLIKRTTRKIELTESGLLYYEHCRRWMADMKESEKLIANLRAEPSGALRITAAPHFGEKFILPKLNEFTQRYSQVKIELELAERMPDLFAENIDLLYGFSMAGPVQAVQKKIFNTRYIYCASPTYLKKFGTPQKPKDLIQHRYITHNMRKPDNVLEFSSRTQIYVTPFLKLNDTRAMLDCALQGMGIVKLHSYVVEEALQQHKLLEILGSFSQKEISVFLYYQPSKYLQPKVRKFIDFFSVC